MRAPGVGWRGLVVLCGLALALAAPAQTAAQLLEQLKSADAATRVTAMQQLGRQRAREAVPALIAVTREHSPTLRAQAATALGQIGDAQATPALTTLLADPFALARGAAAQALGLLKDRAAVPALVKAARNADSGIQATAIEALGRIGDSAAAPDLLALLDDPDPEVRRAVSLALRALNDPRAALALLPGLHDPDPATRLAAVQALAPLRVPEARPTFIALLQDESPEVRAAAAAAALGRYPDANTRDILLATLQASKDAPVRTACLRALAPTRDPRLLEPVLHLLEEMQDDYDNGRLLAVAVEVAGQLRDARAVPLLLPLVGRDIGIGDGRDIRETLDIAFRRIGTPALVALVAQLAPEIEQPDRQAAISALGRWQHPRAVAPLLALLPDGDVGYDAAAALSSSRRYSAYWHLSALSMHEPIAFTPPRLEPGAWCRDRRLEEYLLTRAATHMDAYGHLAVMGSTRVVDRLLAEMHSADAGRKRELIKALCRFDDPRAVPVLLNAFLAENRNDAGWALTRILNPPSLEPYFAALQHKNPEIRKMMAAALGAQDDARAVPKLLNRIQNDPAPEVREYCALALGMIGDTRAVPVLLNRLSDPVEWARSAAAWALGQLGDRRAIIPLQQKLNPNDPRTAVRAARSLAQLGDPVGAEMLLTLLRHQDDMVRSIAAQTAHSLPGPRAVDAALIILAGGDEEAQANTANLLRAIHDPAAVEALLPLLRHEDAGIRTAAAHALGQTGAMPARDPLAACLDVGEVEAAIALVRLGDARGLPTVLEIAADPANAVRADALLALGDGTTMVDPRIAETLAPVLADVDLFTAAFAARALARRGDHRGAEHLIAVLAQDEDPALYLLAVPYLAEIRDPLASAPLQALLPKTTFPARLAIIEALGAIGHPDALPLLGTLRAHPDPRVRAALARGLWGQGAAAVPLLQGLRADAVSTVRAAAERSVARVLSVVGTVMDAGAAPGW